MGNDMGTILVTGATGQQGGAVARHLLSRGHRVRVMTRSPSGERASSLAELGADVASGDFEDPESLERALDGAWGLFSVQNTWEAGVEREEEQGKRVAHVARDQGVQHLVYSSVGSAHRNTGIPHFDNKQRVEETVRSLGFPSYVILRPVFFMENWLSPWFLPALAEGKISIALRPETSLQMIAVDDIGKFGALAFESADELNGREIDLAGDERTMPETVEILSEATGRKIEFVPQPLEEVRQWSEDFAIMLEWFDNVGYNVDIPQLSQTYGITPQTLPEWASHVDWATAMS